MSRAPRLVAALCALSLVAACGGDDDAASTTTVADTTTTESPTTEPDTTEPATTEPVTTEPDTTEPATTEPDTTEPATTEPDTTEPAADTVTLLDVAEEAGEFTILLAAVEAAGLTDELERRDRTLLAPTDAAFEALGQETIDALLADPAALSEVLLNHVLPLPQTAADIALFNNVLVASGASWDVEAGDPFRIGPATVVTADIEADNGIIHVIDTVLVVPAEEPAAEG